MVAQRFSPHSEKRFLYATTVFSQKFLTIKSSAYNSNQIHTWFPQPIFIDYQKGRYIARTREKCPYSDFFSKLWCQQLGTHFHSLPFSHINMALYLAVPAIVAQETLYNAELCAQSKFSIKSCCFSEQQSVKLSSSKGEFVMVDPHCRMSRNVSK